MIAKLTGTIAEKRSAHIVLDVSGVGYLVALTGDDFGKLTEGRETSLFTHLAVRENAMDLYGFLDRDDLRMFELLIGLPKIGPKSALTILSQADATLIRQSVARADASYLSKVSGIGKKSAEKIVLGLKDVFEEEVDVDSSGQRTHDGDVIDALVALGYSERDARRIAQTLPPELTDTNQRIKEALKTLGS